MNTKLLFILFLLCSCSSSHIAKKKPSKVSMAKTQHKTTPNLIGNIKLSSQAGQEIFLYTMGLLDVSYRFGGVNPEAGLDCSGMVSYIYKQALGINLPHHAASIAAIARPIHSHEMNVGDLVFFNTQNRSFSHMGIYIGNQQFVHAPRTNSVVRIDSLNSPYYAQRFEGARTLFQS
jgi:cell wall-associated NlpC family hydrolase